MRKLLIGCLALLAACQALAAGIGLKPGLWEVQIVKQIVDGRDVSAQIAQAASQMQQAMANLPPEARARMEAALKQHGVGYGSNGNFRVCITPKMADSDLPILDKTGRCHLSEVTRNGDQSSYAFSCSSNGVTTHGKGVTTFARDFVSTRTDATTENAQGEKHTVHSESQMKYVGPDCGAIKPPGEQP